MEEYCVVCGHIKKDHFCDYQPAARCVGEGCWLNKPSSWHMFRRDNLKYLEMKYEESLKNG